MGVGGWGRREDVGAVRFGTVGVEGRLMGRWAKGHLPMTPYPPALEEIMILSR